MDHSTSSNNMCTGPRTEAGKAASSQNAAKHFLTCTRFRMTLHESQAEYDALKSALYSEYKPVTPTESMLVERLAQSFWLVQRAIRCASRDGADEREVILMMRYQTTHDRAFERSLKQLKAAQKEREGREQGVPALALKERQTKLALATVRLQLQQRKLQQSAPPIPAGDTPIATPTAERPQAESQPAAAA